MTHPDILTMERLGYLPRSRDPEKLGVCRYCESEIFDTDEPVESRDGLFCSMDCCREYYEIRYY